MKDYIVNKINELCEKRHMSQYELAKKAGMSQSSLSNLMSKRSVPTIGTLEKICNGFGISLAQFFSEEGKFPDLSEEQIEMLNAWKSCRVKKSSLMKILDSIKELRKKITFVKRIFFTQRGRMYEADYNRIIWER